MAPKKREKELDKNRMDHAQADHELFLQAFESKFALLLNSFNFNQLDTLNGNRTQVFFKNYFIVYIQIN